MEALRLAVRTVGPADVRSLVPFEAKPAHVFENAGLRFLGRPLGVGVLDAKDERAFVAVRQQPVEERRASVADVKLAGGPGRKTASHFLVARGPPPQPLPALALARAAGLPQG